MAGLLKKNGIGPYHICYEVRDLEKAIDGLKTKHFVITDPPEKAPALDNRKVVFMYHTKIGLIEVLEERK